LKLLARLQEDGQFGAVNFSFNGQYVVSRDLLDSVLEINFLDRHLRIAQLPSPVFLDIGAGYGRFAYRLSTSLPNVKTVFCADAVAESTFLCEYYLKFRGVADRAKAVPIDEIEAVLQQNHIDVVSNMESFAECTLESIRWWLDLIQRNRASYFMIVVEGTTLLSKEGDGSKLPFQPLLEERNFELMVKEPVYPVSAGVSKYGLYPDRTYFLFRNRAVADKN
jgi:putative sugar O-methyltransferase